MGNVTPDVLALAKGLNSPGAMQYPKAYIRFATLESKYNINVNSYGGTLVFADSETKVTNVPFIAGMRLPVNGSTVVVVEYKSTASSSYIILGNVSTQLEITGPAANLLQKRLTFNVAANVVHSMNVPHLISNFTGAQIASASVFVKGNSGEAIPMTITSVDGTNAYVAIDAGFQSKRGIVALTYYETPVTGW